MGIRSWIAQKRNQRLNKKLFGSSILAGQVVLGDETILSSSDVYHYLLAISNMIACAKWEIEDEDGVNLIDDNVKKVLRKPNGYLTGFEFRRLLVNVYLLQGEAFVVKDNNQLHIMSGITPEITDQGIKVFKYDGHTLYQNEVCQIKNIGLSSNYGSGLMDLARNTLEGVMNAEKAITDKYKKGGLLAYLLKLDTHLSPKNTLQNQMVKLIQDTLEEIPDEGKTVIIPLSKGYNIEGFESPVQDEKILEYLNVYKPELAKFLGFDPDAYNALLKVDLEKAAIYLKSFVVDPIIQNICEHLTFLFYGADSDKRINLNVDIKKYLTMSQKITNVQGLLRSMVYTPDDGRRDLNVDALNTDESTRLYASKDLVGLDDLAELNQSKMKEGDSTG
ncbi:phage portal protein [Enterococcus thailandicus]|uniref:phage portal protein n=1 Tax=Enterococcus thailandicus TaxID=417368 RepID=UPI0028915504|nr:phage portal protein [Enterococcus thailandicus]MDT2794267.1 phage portal protein [Enterococcus thailandicus]